MRRLMIGMIITAIALTPSCGGKKKVFTGRSQLYIVGGGIAGLSAAVFAIRDGRVPGKNIHIFETLKVMGGSLDGAGDAMTGYILRGARKYNPEVYNCTWDLMSAIPTLSDPKKNLKEEFFEFNRSHKKNVQVRVIDRNRTGDRALTMGLSAGDVFDIISLMLTPEFLIENRQIDCWFRPAFFRSNFWIVYASMFGFETYSDLVECKRYFRRFMHAFHQMVKGGGEVVHPLNQYDSLILPTKKWLEKQGVDFRPGCTVTDLDFAPAANAITVNRLHYVREGEKKEIAVGTHDFVFVTNGSMTADSRRGSMTAAPLLERGKRDGSWTLWENLARKKGGLGNPDRFSSQIDRTKWVVFAVTGKDSTFTDLFEKKTGNKPGQSDLVTFKDSGWLMSIHVPDQPQFLNQPRGVTLWGGYGLLADGMGTYVKKKMSECTGAELLTEVCYQFGFEKELPRILKSSICIPSMMPYDVAHFMPRKKTDRPPVVPEGSTNLAFMGQFTESDECVFLVESSVRCGQTAVYKLLGVERDVPPVYTGMFLPWVAVRELAALMK